GRARLLAPPHRVLRAPFASMPPTTQNPRRRDGRADRRQIPMLTLTAQYLRRRRGFTASVFGRVPRAIGHPSLLSAAPHRVIPDERRRSCSVWESEWAKAAILRKACEFHGTRYYEGWSFREKTGFSDQVPGRWRYGTFARGLLTARNASRGVT